MQHSLTHNKLRERENERVQQLTAKQNDFIDRDKRSLTRRTIRYNQNLEVSAQMIK